MGEGSRFGGDVAIRLIGTHKLGEFAGLARGVVVGIAGNGDWLCLIAPNFGFPSSSSLPIFSGFFACFLDCFYFFWICIKWNKRKEL